MREGEKCKDVPDNVFTPDCRCGGGLARLTALRGVGVGCTSGGAGVGLHAFGVETMWADVSTCVGCR